MPRRITDADGVTWTCLQAYAGLSEKPAAEEAARVEGTADRYHVVCTPSGGAGTVRLELPSGWEERLSDEALLREIEAGRK